MSPKPGHCTYCGRELLDEVPERHPHRRTRDHVPGQGYLLSPYPRNVLTVPACFGCNSDLGKAEERVRNITLQAVHPWETGYRGLESKSERAIRRVPRDYRTQSRLIESK